MSTIVSIPLSSIDISSPHHDQYTISYPRDWSLVRESIRYLGQMLYPPIVIAGTARNMYQIICGYRRIRAAMELGWERVDMKLLEPEHYTKTGLLKISVVDNVQGRGLNPVEKSRAFSRFYTLNPHPGSQIVEEFCGILDVACTEDAINRYRMLDGLGDSIKMAICDGSVTMQQGLLLLDLDEKDRETMVRFLLVLKCNTNEIRNFIEGIREIAAKQGLGISAILQDHDILEMLANEELHARQKTTGILDRIHAMRYPQRNLWETRFHEEKAKLRLPQSIHITPSPYFEGNWLELKARFTDARQFEEFVVKLSLPENKGVLRILFKFVDGSYKIEN